MPLPLILAAAAAAQPLPAPSPSPERMKADVAALVAFGTRHTLSATDDPKRGIGAALHWAETQLNAISDECGGCITVANIGRTFTGQRRPTASRLSMCSASSRATIPSAW